MALITQYSSANANLHINYFDPLINQNANFLALDIRKPGIYSGGYLTVINNSTFSLSILTCEIQDSGGSGNQVRLQTLGTPISIPVSNTFPPTLVVLRWTYTTSTAGNYPFVYTVPQGSQLATDLIVGTAAYSGATLSADYGVVYPGYLRSDPTNILDLCLKTEPVTSYPYTITSGVQLRYGRINYGSSTFQIPTQVVPVTASIGTNGYYQVVLLQVSTSGVVSTTLTGYGTPSSSPTPTPPPYGGLTTLSEITVQYTGGLYYITNIKDVRCFANVGVTLNGILPNQVGNAGTFLYTNGSVTSWNGAVDLVSNQAIAGTKTFVGNLVIPAVTADPVSPVNGQIWLRTDY